MPDFTAWAHRGSWIVVALLALSCASSSSLPHQETTVVNLRDFGAAGDGISDDGPALQRALDALATSGGGTLIVSPGRYAIATPVSEEFSAPGSSITIAGQPSEAPIDVAGNGSGLNLTSELLIKVGSAHVALALRRLDALLLKDVAFVGVPDVRDDARVVLWLHEIESATVEHCEFYGLASLAAKGAILAATRSGLKVDRSAFLGCTTNSAVSTSVLQNRSWKAIAITNTKFVDYGTRPGFFSKTPMAPAYSWISIADAVQPDAARREAVLRNLFLDEGALIGISAQPERYAPEPPPMDVFISAIRMNVTNLGGWGIALSRVDKVLIEDAHLGWSHHADAAIVLQRVEDAILDRLECAAHANTIYADKETDRLVVIDSIYETLDSDAPDTRVIKTREPIDDPVQYVRQEYRRILGTEPELPALHFRADAILKCRDDAACLARERSALAKELEAAPALRSNLP
jgi:pectate lyase-like protein